MASSSAPLVSLFLLVVLGVHVAMASFFFNGYNSVVEYSTYPFTLPSFTLGAYLKVAPVPTMAVSTIYEASNPTGQVVRYTFIRCS